MSYHFKNLVFEGGGAKGIAYIGALEELDRKNILSEIRRVGGASVGAIAAALVGLGYSSKEIRAILWGMNLKEFLDSSWGMLRDFNRLKKEFGWYKGDYFRNWMGDLIAEKTGNPNTTFAQMETARLRKKGCRSMYFMVTDLSTGYSEIMSAEKSPGVCVADAVRFSMSIPFVFAAKRGLRGDVYSDGGLLANYPVKMFDRQKYLSKKSMGTKTSYYSEQNEIFLAQHPSSSPYVFNKQTLGFRLDAREQISLFRDQAEPPYRDIEDFFDFIVAVVRTLLDKEDNEHLHSDDWQRTVYIDTLGTGTMDFDMDSAQKEALVESGRAGVKAYFDWYDDDQTKAANK